MRSRAALALLTAAALAGLARAEEDAVRIYRDVQGCVVGLENLEGGGTGILLDRTGLILTPYPYRAR